jgi:hypothetical protein
VKASHDVGAAADRPRRTGREVSLDWVEGSAKFVTVSALFELIAKCLGEEYGRDRFEVQRDDDKWFTAVGPFRIRVQADRVGSVNSRGVREPWCGVRIPGEACRAVGTKALLDLLEMLGLAGKLKVSRLDLALDDFDRTFTPREFAMACVAGRLDDENALLGPGLVTRVRRDSWDWKRRHGGCLWIGGEKSARLLRVYDKLRKSGGAVPSVRVEFQARDEWGTELARQLLRARWEKRPLAEVWAAHVVSYVDLREPTGHRSGSARWRRVPWWAKLVGDPAGVVTAAADDSTVGQWVHHMRKQSGGFLRVLLSACGVDAATLHAALHHPEQACRLIEALQIAVPPGPWRLSGEHEVRLRQLREARARADAFAARIGRRAP